MAFNVFLVSACIYCMTVVLSILDTADALRVRRSVYKILYWIEKIAGATALISGLVYIGL